MSSGDQQNNNNISTSSASSEADGSFLAAASTRMASAPRQPPFPVIEPIVMHPVRSRANLTSNKGDGSGNGYGASSNSLELNQNGVEVTEEPVSSQPINYSSRHMTSGKLNM